MLTTKASIQDILDNDLEQQKYEQTKEVVQLTNAEINTQFLASISKSIKQIILKNIADHYGITPEQAYNEVIGEDAECFLEYMTEPERAGAAMFKRQFMFIINRS